MVLRDVALWGETAVTAVEHDLHTFRAEWASRSRASTAPHCIPLNIHTHTDIHMGHPHDRESTSPVDIQDAATPMSVRAWSHGGVNKRKPCRKKYKFVMECHEKADELAKEDADAEGGNMTEARAQTVRLLRTRTVYVAIKFAAHFLSCATCRVETQR